MASRDYRHDNTLCLCVDDKIVNKCLAFKRVSRWPSVYVRSFFFFLSGKMCHFGDSFVQKRGKGRGSGSEHSMDVYMEVDMRFGK